MTENTREPQNRVLEKLAGRHFFSISVVENLAPGFSLATAGFSCGEIVQIDTHVLRHTGQNYALKLHFKDSPELWEHWSQQGIPTKV